MKKWWLMSILAGFGLTEAAFWASSGSEWAAFSAGWCLAMAVTVGIATRLVDR